MSDAQLLLVVQGHDTTLDQLRHRLEHLPERAAKAQAEAARATAAAAAGAARASLDREIDAQGALETELAGVEAKAKKSNERLYGGQITAVREIQAVQDELAGLQQKASDLSDAVLASFDAVAAAEALVAAADATVGAAEGAVEAATAALVAAIAAVDADVAAAQALRDDAAAPVDPDALARYDVIRARLGGVAMAKLHGRTCTGCHLELPAVDIDRFKTVASDVEVRCPECGRILVRE